MFKETSRASQARALGAALHSTRNTGGVDPTAFKQAAPRGDAPEPVTPEQRIERARHRKVELQAALAKLNAQISHAIAQRTLYNTFVPRNIWTGWQNKKAQLIDDIHKLELELSRAKIDRSTKAEQSEKHQKETFAREFMKAAKRVLASEVYDRIVTATIHAIGEADVEEGK
jgi:hypothetical protein